MITAERRVGGLFDRDPWQWGLRGDQNLWWHMAEVLVGEPWPETAGQLAALIERTFEALPGAARSAPEPFYREQYEQHLLSVLCVFVAYYNHERSHRSLMLQTPELALRPGIGPIRSRPVLNGLHHVYERAA